ncbi:MAG: DNA polymerase I [Candidatus Aminicenantes bacterium]|nr:DNA polymerase I [Candidatus Aminicenantes bacterium]
MTHKRFFLIDGSAMFYRSYYAIRRLSNSKGIPTNAVYGFLLMIRKLISRENPECLAVAYDTEGPTFRHKEYKEYKANRKPMPEDLVSQIPLIKSLVKALRIPTYEFPGYEADDVMGSLSRIAHEENLPTVLVSTDKDLLQLVDRNTSVFNPVKEIYFDEKSVKEQFGVHPHQVTDVLALWGDVSDNIPGIPGVGEKTAKSLINRFGSIDHMIQNIHTIENPKLRKNIQENIDRLKLSYKLASIEKNLNLPFKPEDASLSEPDLEELIPLLKELEFSSIIAEYTDKQKTSDVSYTTVHDENKLRNLTEQIKKAGYVAIDTETDSPFPNKANLVGISFSFAPRSAFYLPLHHDYEGAPAQIPEEKAFMLLGEILADPSIKKTGQNIKYDLIVLQKAGLEIRGIEHDTMILSYLLEPNWGKHNLGRLSQSYLQTKATEYEEITGRGKNQVTMNKVDIKKTTPYACQDADFALRLSAILWPKVKENSMEDLYKNIEIPLIEVLASMEKAGVKVNVEGLQKLSREIEDDLGRLQKKIYEATGVEFNINSPQQLGDILFEKLQLPSSRKTKKTRQYSTSLDVLQELAVSFPIARYVLEYRQLSKLKSTYADALPLLIQPDTGRIHTSYNQTVAATGRLSSSDPNLQNIPVRGEMGQRFRQAFIPEKDSLFLSADYSQIELRVLAHLSEDPALIETFRKNKDIHQETALKVFGDSLFLSDEEKRHRAKIINFSIIYGASAFSLARELGTSQTEAQKFIDRYYEKYPKVREYLDAIVDDARQSGFSTTLFGRKRQVPELQHKNRHSQQAGRRIALNTPIQGSAADLIKKAMIEIFSKMKQKNLRSKMILQVHDELVFEVPDDETKMMEKLVKENMEKVFPLNVPLLVHLGWGINWAEAK